MELIPLHTRQEYLDEAFALLNEQWPRIRAVRLGMLHASRDSLPTSLVLVKEGKVLGHLRMKHLDSLPRSVWIESVVVDKALRGKGYGKALMLSAENYAKKMEFEVAYLNTHDKQGFYATLGYELCAPVSLHAKPINDGWMPNVKTLKENRTVCNNSVSNLASHSCPKQIAGNNSELNEYNNMERHSSLSNGSLISLNDSLSLLCVDNSSVHPNDIAKSNTVQSHSSQVFLNSLSAVDSSVFKPTPTNTSSLTPINTIPHNASTAHTGLTFPLPPPPPPAPPIPPTLHACTRGFNAEMHAMQDGVKVGRKTVYMKKILI